MKVIGITGNSGAGKTTISTILEENYNAYIIDADKIAKEMSRKGTQYLNSIVKYFGKGILDPKEELNRKKLADLIYENEEKRKILNKLTFKYIVKEINTIIKNLKNEELVVIDAPLLFESKLNELCDLVIGVIAKKEDKIERICSRDNITEEKAHKRLSIQKNNEFIREKADYIIVNDSSIEELKSKINKIGFI